jgi:hypothetical protein
MLTVILLVAGFVCVAQLMVVLTYGLPDWLC